MNKTENILAPLQKIACILFGCLFFVSLGFAQQRKLSPAQQDKIRLKNGQIIDVSAPNQSRPMSRVREITWEDMVYLNWEPESVMLLTS